MKDKGGNLKRMERQNVNVIRWKECYNLFV
jgi:hypothetical protein